MLFLSLLWVGLGTWYLKHCPTLLIGKVFLGTKQKNFQVLQHSISDLYFRDVPLTSPLPFDGLFWDGRNEILVKLFYNIYLPFALGT